jgi:hypothetical protein
MSSVPRGRNNQFGDQQWVHRASGEGRFANPSWVAVNDPEPMARERIAREQASLRADLAKATTRRERRRLRRQIRRVEKDIRCDLRAPRRFTWW